MTPAQHARAKELFALVMSVAPEERKACLEGHPAEDIEVRAEVERLLRAEPTRSGLGRAGMEIASVVAAGAETERQESLVGRSVAHYDVEKLLGSGGMGDVYLARDRALVRLVALKVLPVDFHPSIRDRLLREAWASARVQHPGIATFFDAGRADGVDYIAMEHVSGQTLRDHLRSGALPVTQGLEIVAGLLEALVHAHHAGIMHRDIKPENIMLTPEGKAKLLDFGLAKAVPAGESRTLRPPSATLPGSITSPAPEACWERWATWHPSRSAAKPPTLAPMCSRSAPFSTRSSPGNRRSPVARRHSASPRSSNTTPSHSRATAIRTGWTQSYAAPWRATASSAIPRLRRSW